jgi:hypothetical protein
MKKFLVILSLIVVSIVGVWIAATSGNPSFVERFRYSQDMESCRSRSGCWDYARHGCVFAKSAFSTALEPTPAQAAADACYTDDSGKRLREEMKHLWAW